MAWEDTVAADMAIMGRAEVGSSSAASKHPTHTLATEAEREEAEDQVVARLRLERRLLRGVTNLAVAVTNDVLTGKPWGNPCACDRLAGRKRKVYNPSNRN